MKQIFVRPPVVKLGQLDVGKAFGSVLRPTLIHMKTDAYKGDNVGVVNLETGSLVYVDSNMPVHPHLEASFCINNRKE